MSLKGKNRTMTNENGETFFVGKDVATALGYSNTRKALIDHVDNPKLVIRPIMFFASKAAKPSGFCSLRAMRHSRAVLVVFKKTIIVFFGDNMNRSNSVRLQSKNLDNM